MANAAFDAWVVKFLGAVSAYDKQAIALNGWLNGKGDRNANPVSAYNKILTLRSDLAVILNSSAIGSEAIISLDKIISSGGRRTRGGYGLVRFELVREWIKKYSVLLG